MVKKRPEQPNHSLLIQTKLHRPPVPKNHVDRTHLLERFEPHHQRHLTLTTDPASYGKSILISRWLETNNCPSAWLSLVYILDGEMPASCGASSLFVDMIDHPATPILVAGVHHRTPRRARSRMRQRGMG
jgi:LuxR family maltose regulon positive regulatory protein